MPKIKKLYNKRTRSSINLEDVIKVPSNKRVLGFFYGDYWVINRSDCRGCIMQSRREEMAKYMLPIYEDDDVWVVQDAEFAVPGFYIVGTKKHLAGFADFSLKTSLKIGIITHLVRKGMKDLLNIQYAEIYHEERMKNSHYHHWILPLWEYAVKRSGYMPTIFPSKVSGYKSKRANIIKYLRCFNFEEEGEKILKFNDIMRKHLSSKKVKAVINKIDSIEI